MAYGPTVEHTTFVRAANASIDATSRRLEQAERTARRDSRGIQDRDMLAR